MRFFAPVRFSTSRVTLALISACVSAAQGALTSVGVVDLSPGIDVHVPQRVTLNRSVHKLYVSGYGNGQSDGIKVVDTISGAVIGGIDLGRYAGATNPFTPQGLAADDSAGADGNKLYVVGTPNGTSWYLRVIDCATDTNLTAENSDVFLPMGGTGQGAGDNTPSTIAVNPNNHKIYIAEQNGDIVIVDGPGRKVISKIAPNVGDFVVAAPTTNNIFVVNRNGGAMIDSATDTVTPLALTFSALDGVFNPADGRLYFVGYPGNASGAISVVDATSGQLVISKSDVPQAPTSFTKSVTIVPEEQTLYVGSSTTLTAYDTRDLTIKASLPQHAFKLAYDPGSMRKLFLLHEPDPDGLFNELTNAVGVLDRVDYSLQRAIVGYQPGDLGLNSRAGRLYVMDQQSPDIVVADASNSSVTSHIAVATQTPRRFAVSERLDRVYVSRIGDAAQAGFVDVYDAATNQLRSSIAVDMNVGHVAVDDTRRHVYVCGSRSRGSFSADFFVEVFDEDTEIKLAAIPVGSSIFSNSTGIAVNETTGRVYASFFGIRVIDGNTLTKVADIPNSIGPLAVNRLTNKLYVAPSFAPASGGVQLWVIDGVTNAVERTISVPVQNSNDTVTALAVDPSANSVDLVLNPASYPKPPGAVLVFAAAQDYELVQQTSVGLDPVAAVFDPATGKLFVSNSDDGTVSVLQSSAAPSPNILANISTRGLVGTADDALIGGFIVNGPQGSTKRVMVRAVGPSLAAAGVVNPLQDTILELHDSAGNVVANDDWKTGDSQQQEIENSGIAPSDDRESAIVATLTPGPCTGVVRGKNGATGVALVEVYDLDSTSSATLANISTRGPVGGGDNVLIGGIIVSGSQPIQTLIRAIGRSLESAGVNNPLLDPTLELRDPNGGLITTNDNWPDDAAEISGTQLAPTDPHESAVLATLYPGNYTAIVRGKNDTTGVALVEAYHLP